MSDCLTPEDVEAAFLEACRAELRALKPGNVHVHAGGHKMSVADFEKSAVASAPGIAATGLSVGDRIFHSIKATREVVGCNTNLGIVLLAAPIAQAVLYESSGNLRARVSGVLEGLSIEDAQKAYDAIRLAEPGGLGDAKSHDVADVPEITLLEAMGAAEGRDRIAYQYSHGYADIVDIGLARLHTGLSRWGARDWAVAYAYFGFLSQIPDTLIVRKYGAEMAEEVRVEAAQIDASFDGCERPDDLFAELIDFDERLKLRGLNPGTSADLTVATIFWDEIAGRLT